MLNSLQQCNQIDWTKGNGPTDMLTVPASIALCGDNVEIGLVAKTTVADSPLSARTGERAIHTPLSLSYGLYRKVSACDGPYGPIVDLSSPFNHSQA